MWIETQIRGNLNRRETVTPYAGVWIETDKPVSVVTDEEVTPYAGVWIETTETKQFHNQVISHTLRGCVD